MSNEIARENREDDKLLLDAQWQKQQVKSFTAWVNSHLMKVGEKIEDITTDFQNGRRLIKLVEVISGEALKRPEKGNMRLHHIQNINIALEAIAAKGVKLAGVSAEEIADCNVKLILGMIWILILRFQIQDISVEELSAKEGLLLWCQRKTAGYSGCNVQNFHISFQDGNAFCALIHRHRPDLLDYNEVMKKDKKERLNTAFKVAEDHLGIPQMLDANDMLETTRPDERSVMTYVAAYYHAFAGMGQTENAARRIADALALNRELQKLIDEYEARASDLIKWIQAKITENEDTTPHSTLPHVSESFEKYRSYKKNEKPPKSQEKVQLEAHYSTLQTRLRLNNRPPYHPQEGLLISDIEKHWKDLDGAEKHRETFLRKEQERLEYLERLAKKFAAKASIHGKWMGNRIEKLQSSDYGHDLPSVTALIRQHKAAEGDIEVHSDRVPLLAKICGELEEAHYHNASSVRSEMERIEKEWQTLVSLSQQRKSKLEEELRRQERLDELQLQYSSKAESFNKFAENTQEDLLDDLGIRSLENLKKAKSDHEAYKQNVAQNESMVTELRNLGETIHKEGASETAYTSVTVEAVQSSWDELQGLLRSRDEALKTEEQKQNAHEKLRVDFAAKANPFGKLLEERIKALREFSAEGSLEAQVQSLESIRQENQKLQSTLEEVHAASAQVEKENVSGNPHAEYSVEDIDALYQQLDTLSTRSINTLQNQILMRDQSGISEAQMKEYRESFKFFDKDQSGDLDAREFRSCLLSIGYNLPEAKGADDEAFLTVMRQIDPEGTGRISFEAFVDFVSKDKKVTNSSKDLLEAFTLLAGDKPYITEDVVRRELPASEAEYALSRLKPYPGVPGGLDYKALANELFSS